MLPLVTATIHDTKITRIATFCWSQATTKMAALRLPLLS